jgi:DNA-binding MarR family transcriptional regulator
MDRTERNDLARQLYIRAFTTLDPMRLRWWSEMGLTTPQLRVIFLLRETPGMSAGELAQSLGVTPPTVSGIVDRLVRVDLLRREEDPADRRLVRNFLTEKGQMAAGEVERTVTTFIMSMMDRLSDRELDDVTKALNLLIRVGDEARAELVGPLLETT